MGKFNSGHFLEKQMLHETRQVRTCETGKNGESLYKNKRNNK